jgi:hypothetical protein
VHIRLMEQPKAAVPSPDALVDPRAR